MGAEFEAAEQTFGCLSLQLTAAAAYLRRLLGNRAVAEYVGRRHPAVLSTLEATLAAILTSAQVSDESPADEARAGDGSRMEIGAAPCVAEGSDAKPGSAEGCAPPIGVAEPVLADA
jgi:hypothetical protein